MAYSSAFSWPSRSACVCALTSRRRIFSAPATARAATCSRKLSRARLVSWSMFGLGSGELTLALFLGCCLWLHRSICAARFSAWAITSAACCLGITHVVAGFSGSQLQLVLAAICRSQAVGNLLLAHFERIHDRRPHVLHAEPHEEDERDGLADQSCVEVHIRTLINDGVKQVPNNP